MKTQTKIQTQIIIVFQMVLILFLFVIIFYSILNAIPFGLLVIFLFYSLKSKTEKIIVDASGVMVYNWLTVDRQLYRYEDFDKVVFRSESIGYFDRLDIYLLKDKDLICRISGHNYENVDDLLGEIEKRKP